MAFRGVSVYSLVLFLALISPSASKRIAHDVVKAQLDIEEEVALEVAIDEEQLSALTFALEGAKTRVGALKEAFAARLETVPETLGDYAESTRDKVLILGANLLEAGCDPENHAKVQAVLASVQSRVGQVATVFAEKWPEVQKAVNSFAMVTGIKLRSMAKQLYDVVREASEREEVSAIFERINGKFEELRAAAVEATQQEQVEQFVSTVSAFSDSVAEASQKISEVVTDIAKSKQMQAILSTIQSRAGQLTAMAMAKWPFLKAKLAAFAEASRLKIAQLGGDLMAAINICDPQVRQAVAQAFEAISVRVTHIARTVAHAAQMVVSTAMEKWPMIQEGIGNFAQSVSENLVVLRGTISTAVTTGQAEAQQMMVVLQDQARRLEAAARDKMSAASDACDNHETCSAVADKIQSALGGLLQRLNPNKA